MLYRAHVIQLRPNNKQATYFKQACGVARFSYNWVLAEWMQQYQQGLKPNAFVIKKQFNTIKHTQFPFVSHVTKCAAEQAILQLGDAFKRFFKNESRYPKFRKKGRNERFSLTNDQFKIEDKKIRIPKLGWVRMTEKLRFKGKILSAKVFSRGGKWFVSIAVELAEAILPQPKTQQSVGVDLGITTLATLSTGEKITAPKPLKRKLKKLKRLSRKLSRKQKGGKNYEKAKTKLSSLHYHIACQRKDFLNKLTTELVQKFDTICLEDLNIRGMLRNRKLSRAISDLGFYEFRRQLLYKAEQWGKGIRCVDRFFPSSKLCSHCGHIMDTLPLLRREWVCPTCQVKHDRDVNASVNILRHAQPIQRALNGPTVGSTVSACGVSVSLAPDGKSRER